MKSLNQNVISNQDFNHFLRTGSIDQAEPETPVGVLQNAFNDDSWMVKEIENNGLAYGIVKRGITEFHIYNEKISGYSFRPDLPFSKKHYGGTERPWIIKNRGLNKIEHTLRDLHIGYKKYVVEGPMSTYQTAGAVLLSLEKGTHIFLDTESGVTFLFELVKNKWCAYQICKYYSTE